MSCPCGHDHIATGPALSCDRPLELPHFKDVQRSEDAKPEDLERGKNLRVLRLSSRPRQNLVKRSGCSLARPLRRWRAASPGRRGRQLPPGSDDDRELAGILDSVENDPIGVPEHAFGQHLKERVHRDVEKRLGAFGIALLSTLPTPLRKTIRATLSMISFRRE